MDILAQAHHEGGAHAVPIPPEPGIVVSAVCHDDAPAPGHDVVGTDIVSLLAVRDMDVHRQEVDQ